MSWLIPLAYSAAGLIAGTALHRAAILQLPDSVSDISVAAALSIYSAIGSGMIALTGIVFSFMFLLVQFSASIYSPRLVFWIAHDIVVSHALGVFSATFLYAITAAAWVDRGGSGRVPLVGVAVGTALLIASVCMFIVLTQRVSVLQVNRMVVFTADRGRQAIESVYASAIPAAREWTEGTNVPGVPVVLHHGRPQYVQTIDVAALTILAHRFDAVIEVVPAVGEPVPKSTPLARIHGNADRIPDKAIRRALTLGNQRAFEQDPAYAIRLLVDIAIRALSPAVNDPTTAVQALDQIGDLLLRLGRCRLDRRAFPDVNGRARVVVRAMQWEDYLRLALDEIRSCGASSVQIMRRINALVADLTALLPDERRPALLEWRARLLTTLERAFVDPKDTIEASQEDPQGLGSGRCRSVGAPA